LAKLYGCSTTDFIKTQIRHRADITRSCKDKETGEKRTKFSEARNQEFLDFCRATGLRRDEIMNAIIGLIAEYKDIAINTDNHKTLFSLCSCFIEALYF